MKRILAFILTLTLLFTVPLLYACDSGSTDTGDENSDENGGEIKDPAGDEYTPDENDPDENEKPEEPETVTLKIGSYNIANGSYVKHDMQKLADDILALDLDIVGLQEVDKLSSRSQNIDTMKELAELTGYEYYYFSKAISLESYGITGEYGTGILSKYEIAFNETYPLESGGREQRVLGYASIFVEGVEINFFNTHLSWEDNAIRKGQFEAIDEIASKYNHCILTGDFNLRSVAECEVLETLTPTNTEENPLESYKKDDWDTKCIDNILFSQEFELKNSGILENDHSDHYLLWAELEFTPKD